LRENTFDEMIALFWNIYMLKFYEKMATKYCILSMGKTID